MIEVVLASSICITAIVPALAILRDGIALGEIIDTRHLLLTYGVSKMEEQLAVVGATWATGTVTGNFASDGQSTIRYQRYTLRCSGRRRNCRQADGRHRYHL